MIQCNVGTIVSMHSQRAVVSAVHHADEADTETILEIHPPFIYQSEILHRVPLSGVTVVPISELDEALPVV